MREKAEDAAFKLHCDITAADEERNTPEVY